MVDCPVCANGATDVKFRVSASTAAQHFVHRAANPKVNAELASHISDLWSGRDCEIRICRECGFGFASPFISGDARFYNLAYPSVSYPRMKWEFARTIDAVRASGLSSKTALEVGAGYGFFLDQLCGAGFSPANIVAIEYNDGAIAELRGKGYAAIASDLRSEEFANQNAAFDFIFMFQVVEHMADLEALFERLSFLLRPCGHVFIAVPNINRTNYQEAHGSLLDMPPNHVSRWTGEAFTKLSSRHGLRLAEIEIEPFSFSVFLPMDIRYSHLRRAQELPASFSGVVRSMRRGNARKFLEITAMLAMIPARLPHWLTAYRQREKLGASLWVKLQKI